VLGPRADFYAVSLPTPADVLLVIEVSETTLDYDRAKKLPLYARAGVPEVWIVNLAGGQVETHAEPADGVYQVAGVARRGEELRSRGVADLSLEVSSILG
jgi:Uma2 family endonuclease